MKMLFAFLCLLITMSSAQTVVDKCKMERKGALRVVQLSEVINPEDLKTIDPHDAKLGETSLHIYNDEPIENSCQECDGKPLCPEEIKQKTFEIHFCMSTRLETKSSEIQDYIANRKFKIRFPVDGSGAVVDPQTLIVQSHGAGSPSIDHETRFMGLDAETMGSKLPKLTNAALLGTWGSDDVIDTFTGNGSTVTWNAWGWDKAEEPATIPTGGKHKDAQCSDKSSCVGPRNVKPGEGYACMDTMQIIGGKCTDQYTETCACMSAQNDLKYMMIVIKFATEYTRWALDGGPVKRLAGKPLLLVGQSMGGIISAATTQKLMELNLMKNINAVPISAAGARNHIRKFPSLEKHNVRILHMHGVYDSIISTCLDKDDMTAIGFDNAIGPDKLKYNKTLFDLRNVMLSDSNCKDAYGHPSCYSSGDDYYVYSSLKATISTYLGKDPPPPGSPSDPLNLAKETWRTYTSEYTSIVDFPEGTSEECKKEIRAVGGGTKIRCAVFNKWLTVCIYDGPHTIPFQYSTERRGQKGSIEANTNQFVDGKKGRQAFATMIEQWLNEDVCAPELWDTTGEKE